MVVLIEFSYPGAERLFAAAGDQHRTHLVSGRHATLSRVRTLIPLAAGVTFRRTGPIYSSASFSPGSTRSHIHPAQHRPRPAELSLDKVSGSGEFGARRHETGFGEPPQRNEQLAGDRHNHHTTNASPGSGGALLEPLA